MVLNKLKKNIGLNGRQITSVPGVPTWFGPILLVLQSFLSSTNSVAQEPEGSSPHSQQPATGVSSSKL
jgi:hypothetical protein